MGCCSLIILFFLAIAIAFIYVTAAMAIFDIIFFILTIVYIVRVINANRMRPSKMMCPNCNSIVVKLSTRESGSTTNASYYRYGSTWNNSIHYQRIATCKDCGFVWEYITKDDIRSEKIRSGGALIVSTILFVICIVITMELMSI